MEILGHSLDLLRTSGSRAATSFLQLTPAWAEERGKQLGKHLGLVLPIPRRPDTQVAEVMLRVLGSPGLALCCGRSFLFWLSQVRLKSFDPTTSHNFPSERTDFQCIGTNAVNIGSILSFNPLS